MTTGMEVWTRAMELLGYTAADGTVDPRQSAEQLRRGLAVINQEFADLWPLEHEGAPAPLQTLEEPIPLCANTIGDVRPYGAAMFLAAAEGDAAAQALYAGLYGGKRQAARHPDRRRLDRQPSPLL